jgi:dTDP-4-amino-4,6-dideoxygalactose transaminase
VVFVDVQPGTLVMDPDAVEQAITSRTRVILPVHLYGQPCDMARLSAITRRHGLKLVEDGAQAHGARWCGQQTGSFGDMACFSFYPGKNLGAYGDGGAVVGNDPALIGRVRMLANHGRQEKYLHEIEGMNSRLDGLQAAVLRVKLPYLDRANAARRRHAARYLKRLAGQDRINCPTVAAGAEPVWHLFVVQVDDRAAVGAALKARGIATGIHYPVPLHRQPVYADWGLESGALPVTEAAAARILSLPMFPELTEAQIEAVADALIEAVRTTTADASAAFDVTA